MISSGLQARFAALGARPLYLLIAATSIALILAALYMQHVVGLNPCPLCILQRVAFFLLALLAALAAWRSPRPAGRYLGVAALITALAGAGVAAWHVRLKNMPETLSCGPGLGAMLENFPLTQVLPRIFRGSGDCADASAVLFGVSLAGWSLAGFLGLALVTIAAVARR